LSDLIKWTGSKASQADNIIQTFPGGKIDTYWEPFIGGGSVFLALVAATSTVFSSINKFYISDYNKELIGIWKLLQSDPDRLCAAYTEHHKNHNIALDAEQDTCLNRQHYYKKVRAAFNQTKQPEDLFFLMRTSINGLVRYNRKREFNAACHFNRPGMSPEDACALIKTQNRILKNLPVEIHHHSYEEIRPEKNDVVYLDPPYENTVGMYQGGFDNNKFLDWVNSLTHTRWFLSYDGSVDGKDVVHRAPIYREKQVLYSGQSSFRKVLNEDTNVQVRESLYTGGTDHPLPPMDF